MSLNLRTYLKRLPDTDYWFSVQLIDNEGNIRERKGNFILISR